MALTKNFTIIYSTPKLLMIINGYLCVRNYIVLRSIHLTDPFYIVRICEHHPRKTSTFASLHIDETFFNPNTSSKRILQAKTAYESDKYNDVRNMILETTGDKPHATI